MKRASGSVAWKRIIPPATLLLVSFLAAGPLWGPGLLNTRGGGDSPFLLLRTHQLAANLQAGVFPARWMPDAAYGFGYPFFSYYASLPYYLASGAHVFGLDILTAIKLTQTMLAAAAALSMYGWAQRVLDRRAGAWLAAVAYTFAPFHLVNLYVRGDSLSEFAAFAFYPLVLWALDWLASDPSLRRALVPALAYGSLVITHNASALIFSPFILLYVLLKIVQATLFAEDRPRREVITRLLLLLLPLPLGLLLSAWFWLPALAETSSVQLTAQTTGYFFYGNHFRGSNLVQRGLVFDYATGRSAGSPFAMGLVQSLLTLAGIIVLSTVWLRSRGITGRKDQTEPGSGRPGSGVRFPVLMFALVALILSTWLITPLSKSLWDHLPLLPMVQFPWRFLSIQAFFAALVIGAVIAPIADRRTALSWVSAIVLGTVTGAVALYGLQPEYLQIRASEVTAERLQLYELFTGNIGSTIRHEYLPRWVKPRPYIGPQQLAPDTPPRAIPISGELLKAERLSRRPTARVWRVVTGGEGSEVAFPLYYWPGWFAKVDGARVKAQPASGSGYLSLDIPEGAHTVEIRLGRTPIRLASEVVSLITALAALGLAIAGWTRNRDVNSRGGQDGPRLAGCRPRALIMYLPPLALLSLAMAFHPRVSVSDKSDLTMDFEQMPYLHHNPDGVDIDSWKLTTYSFQSQDAAYPETIQPGTPLEVSLGWSRDHSPPPASASPPSQLRLVSPAAVRTERVPAVTKAAIQPDPRKAEPGSTGSSVATLSIPPKTGPGVYLLQIVGSSRREYLRPVHIAGVPGGEDRNDVRATFADEALRLHDVRASQSGPDQLDVELQWSAARPVAANYGLNLSLTDPAGNEWLRQGSRLGYDTQPGHGFLPTSLWPPHGAVYDQHRPSLEPGAPPGDAYTLTVDLYEVATLESVGQYAVTMVLHHAARRPDAPVLARLGGELVLSRLEAPRQVWQGETLPTTAYWTTVKQPSEDYVVEWRLTGSDESIEAARPLAPGSSPKQWPADVWVAGRTALPIPPTAPPGDYTLSLTLVDPVTSATIGSYKHPGTVEVRERARVWELPQMEEEVGAKFGDMIELAGYDLSQGRDRLQLTLYWRAVRTPDRHYMFFVHLADPQTGEPVSQIDSMPREFNYPTGQWAPGEVVSDVVELPLGDVPPGRYDLAVGWYDPDTRDRLRAVDSSGEPVSDDRLLLPSAIAVP